MTLRLSILAAAAICIDGRLDACEAIAIGNDSYSAQRLGNAGRDAGAVSRALSGWGCASRTFTDLTGEEIERQVVDLARRADELTVLYFAGHGFTASGEQFVLGVNADPLSATPGVGAVSVRRLGELLRRVPGGLIVITDSCRTAPQSKPTHSGSIADQRPDSLFLSSTSPGQSALDQPEAAQGLFVQHFVPALLAERDFLSACSLARTSVIDASNSAQVPVLQSSLRHPFIRGQSYGQPGTTPSFSIEPSSRSQLSSIERCKSQGRRLPTHSEAKLIAVRVPGAVWSRELDSAGFCQAVGGGWYPGLPSIDPRSLSCETALPTVRTVCVDDARR